MNIIKTHKQKRIVKKGTSLLLIFAILSGQLLFVTPKETKAAAMKIRQEINIIDTYMVAASGSFATSSAIIQLDTTKYVNPTYYFEVVASTSASLATEVYLRTTTGIGRATTTIPTNTTTYTRRRSSAFTPPTGQTNFVVTINNTAGGNKGIIAARIIIIDDASDFTSSQTQIEIGNHETGKTNTSSAALSNPKYWKYNSSKWDGTTAFYAEVTYQNNQTSSTTLYTTATTSNRTATYIASKGVSYVQIEAWGAGGGGSIGNAGGGGGGGGAYARSTTTVAAGSSHTLFIPAGGVTDTLASAGDATYDTDVVVADGGTGTNGNSAGTGGTTGNSTGQVLAAGGDGGVGHTTGDVGGGGGGAAGPQGAGATASGAASGAPTPGGAGSNGSGGAGGAAGTGDGASCPTSAGKAGVNNTNGGGGGGGADGNGSNTCTGGAGGYPGGGGGSSELAGATQAGGAGQMRLMETHGAVGVAIEEDDGSFGSWTFKAQIVVDGVSTSTPTLVRSSAFTPTDGRHYRLVASSTANSTATYSIYNAKIIVDQSGTISKLEPQYLLANTSFGGTTGLKDYDTYFDPDNEWDNVDNVYIHEANGASSGTGDVKLQSDPNGTPADISGSDITNVVEVEQGSANLTMPGAAATIDVNVTGTGTLNGSRIIVQVASVVVPEPVKISSASNQRFTIGQATTAISPITITDATTPEITTTNDIRVAIATTSGFGMEWDTSDTSATITGSASGKVDATVSYEGASILLITVTSNFAAGEGIVISDLKYTNFTAPAKSGTEAITLHTDGSTAGLAAASTTQIVTIDFGRRTKLSKPPNYLSQDTPLVGYWTFDGKDLYQNLEDVSVNDNHGRLLDGTAGHTGTSTMTVSGRIGQALDFDGTNDSVNLGQLSSLTIKNFTVMVWFKREGDGTTVSTGTGGQIAEPIVAKLFGESETENLNGNFFIGVDQSLLTIAVDFEKDASSNPGGAPTGFNAPIDGVTAITNNTWNHVAYVVDTTSMHLYLNGHLDASISTTSQPQSPSDQYLCFARACNSSGSPSGAFNGVIDEVRIYNRVLSAAEIASIYHAGRARFAVTSDTGANSSGLTAHYTFDGKNMYQNVQDVSGNGNTGFLVPGASGNTSTSTLPGRLGQALEFDGSDDVVNASSDFISTGADSFAAWIKPDGLGESSVGRIVDNGQVRFYISSSNTVSFSSDNGSTVANSAASAFSLNDWTFVAVTRNSDGTATNFYVNGQLSGTANQSSGTPAGGSAVTVGNNSAGSATFDGLLDDVRIFNRVLSASEISQLYRAGGAKIKK